MWPQPTVETDGELIVIVNVAVLLDAPAGPPDTVMTYTPAGTMDVVETVKVETAPCWVGLTLDGEKAIDPHGLELPVVWHTAGFGEIDTSRFTC